MQEEEYLSSNKNLDEDFEDELNDEPPWRTPVTKGWEVKDKKNKIEACDELDGALNGMIEIILELRKTRWTT